MAKKMNSDFTSSYNENIKNEIDKFINNENIFQVLIGINGSGKTTYLNQFAQEVKKENKDKINLINVPSEIYLDDEILKGGTQKSPSILADLLTFIQKLINQTGTFKYKIDSECESEFNKIDKLWNCIKSQNDENDMHNHKKDIINSNLIQLEKSKDLPIFDIKDKTKELGNDISTGDKFYTLISLMNDILTVLNATNKKTILLIDEPEKFLHPTLINIVGTILCKFYYKHNISLIITTHSPILLKSIVENSRYLKQKSSKSSNEEDGTNKESNNQNNNSSTSIEEEEYSTNKEYPKILLFKKEIQSSSDQSKYNYTNNEINLFKIGRKTFELYGQRLISLIDSLFVEKIILVEGIRDQAFVNIIIDLINQKSGNYKYVLVMPCNGYVSLIDYGKIFINEFKLKVLLILDLDNKEKKRQNDKDYKNNKDKLDDEKIDSQNYFLFENDLEHWIKRNLEFDLYPGSENKKDIIQLYDNWSKLNLDYDSFKKKNDECRNLLEKLESFLES